MFLSPDELFILTGYHPSQRKRMRAWLEENGYPYSQNRLGDPAVLRSDVEGKGLKSAEPDLTWLRSA